MTLVELSAANAPAPSVISAEKLTFSKVKFRIVPVLVAIKPLLAICKLRMVTPLPSNTPPNALIGSQSSLPISITFIPSPAGSSIYSFSKITVALRYSSAILFHPNNPVLL